MTQKPPPSIRIVKANPGASMRLFCFPYSGGSAQIYKNWAAQLPSFVEVNAVELPGRSGRFRDQKFTSVPEAIASLVPDIRPYTNKPFALFGHSLGACLAYEMARALEKEGRTAALVTVSGMMSPENPSDEPQIYHLPDAEFKQKVREYNGTPQEVMAHEELMDLILPILKADFTMADTYTYKEGPKITSSLAALTGTKDPHTNEEGVRGWANYTTGAFTYQLFPGDHFFVNDQETEVLALLSRLLKGSL